MHAEQAYLFRHTLLREAAYQLQLPGDRAKLHGIAFELLEALVGSPLRTFDPWTRKFVPHPSDPLAAELALHARGALELPPEYSRGLSREEFSAAEAAYSWRAALWAQRAFRFAEAAKEYQHVERATGDMNLRAGALLAASEALVNARELDQAGSLLESALEICRKQDNRRGIAAVLSMQADLDRECAKPTSSLKLAREALELLRGQGAPELEAVALGRLAEGLLNVGQSAEAEDAFGRAREMLSACGEWEQAGKVGGNLALLYRRTGRPAEAEALYLEAWQLAQRNEDSWTEGIWLMHLADLYELMGRNEEADQFARRALAKLGAVGARRDEGIVLGNLGNQRMNTQRWAEAEVLYRQALAIARETGDVVRIGLWLGNLSDPLVRLGRDAEARACLLEALELARKSVDRRREAFWLANLGMIESGAGRPGPGAQYLTQAIEIMFQLADIRMEGLFRCARAQFGVGLGDIAGAMKDWNEGLALVRKAKALNALEETVAQLNAALAKAGLPPLTDKLEFQGEN